METICYAIALPTAGVVGYLLYHKLKELNKKSESTLLRFDSTGVKCRKCFRSGNSICNNTDCAFKKFDYVCSIIRNAKKKVDVCIPMCTLPKNRIPFIDAHENNKSVRVIFDGSLSREGIGGTLTVGILEEAGVSIRFGKKSHTMHHKFILVDDQTLILCTQSFTVSGFFGNFENIEITNCKIAVESFKKEFSYLWETCK